MSRAMGSGPKLAAAALHGLTVIQAFALQFDGACLTLAAVRAIRTRGSVAVAVLGLAATMTLQYLAFALAPLVAANAIAY